MRNLTPKPSLIVETSLFATDAEIAPRVAAGLTVDEWKAQAAILERQGLPKVDPIMRRRYWPAVKSFFDRQYGIHEKQLMKPDGPEDMSVWNNTQRRASSAVRAKTGRIV